MHNVTKFALILGFSIFLSSCGGGGSSNSSTTQDNGNKQNVETPQNTQETEKPEEVIETIENNDSNYTDDIDFNEYDNYSGNDYDGGENISLDNLAGYGVKNPEGRYIAFCSDHESYYYLNTSNEEESGTYSVTDNGLEFTSSDGNNYNIETPNGYLEVDKSYNITDIEEFAVNEVVPSGC